VKSVITTDGIEPSQRNAFWSDFVCAKLVMAECELSAGSPFRGGIELVQLPEMSVSQISAGTQRVTRHQSHLAQACDEQFVVMLQREGQCVAQQRGHSAVLRPGDLAFYTSNQASELRFDGSFKQTLLVVSASLMRSVMDGVDDMGLVHVAAGHPGTRLLSTIADSVLADTDALTQEACAHLRLSLLHTLAATTSQYQPKQREDGRKLQLYHLVRIKSFIRTHLASPQLDVPWIASALRLSVSHMHRIFASETVGVAEFIWQERLETCRRDLEDSGKAGHSLSEIAYSRGFNDAAHFSRAFKRAYGKTPREWRIHESKKPPGG
jgi:AraC-like DNA-binding protein